MRRVSLLTSVLAALLGMTSASGAQTATGQITGTVTDATGALMAGARSRSRRTTDRLARETTTSDRGDLLRSAAPCRRVPGHRRKRRASRSADPLGRSRSTSTRSCASTCCSMPGTSPRPSKCRRRAWRSTPRAPASGHTITEKQVTELPLNGRNFLQLLFLGAGAVETDGEQGGMRQGAGNAISIIGCPADVEQLS